MQEIYSSKKPDIISFISDEDYKLVLELYKNNNYGKNYKELEKIINKSYPYNKYEWTVLLQIVWSNQNYYKHLQEFQKTGIKKVKLSCDCGCECCKDFANKEIDIKDIKELPMKECLFEIRVCQMARYMPVVEFENVEIKDPKIKKLIDKKVKETLLNLFKLK